VYTIRPTWVSSEARKKYDSITCKANNKIPPLLKFIVRTSPLVAVIILKLERIVGGLVI
jgi:hypothetical protein